MGFIINQYSGTRPRLIALALGNELANEWSIDESV